MKNSLSFAAICRVVANLGTVATAFLSIRVYNFYVSKEIYGVIMVGLQIIGYLPLMSGGFRMVLNQRMLAEPDAEAAKATAWFGQAMQSYFLIVVLIGGMVLMAGYSQVPATRALGLPLLLFIAVGAAAAVTFHTGSQLALLVASGEQVKSSLLQSLWGILGLIILWVSFRLGWGIWAFPASIGGGAFLILLCAGVLLRQTTNRLPLLVWHREKDFWERFKALWRPGLDCLHNQVATVMIFTLDIVFVGILIGPGQAAVYGIVSRIMAISRQMMQSLSEAAWPRLAQELDTARKAQMMRKVDRLNAWLAGCWFGAMAVTLQPFLGWLVKPDWVAGIVLLELLLVRHFIVSLTIPHAYGLLSQGRFKDMAKISQLEAVLAAVAGVTLSCTVGVKGTAVAFLAATCVVTAWRYTREYFRFANDTHWFAEWCAVWGRGMTGAVLSLAIAMAVWWAMRSSFAAPGWMAILAGGIGFGIPVGVVMGLRRLTGSVP